MDLFYRTLERNHTMRLLHTSDWHLGASDSNLSYKDDQLCFIDVICDLIDEKNIDAV